MHSAWRFLLLSPFIVGCTFVDEGPEPVSPSGSGGSLGSGASSSSSDTGDNGESDTGDLGTDTGADLPGCDLLANPLDACGPNMACDPETLACVPASGTGIVDESCIDDTECTPGLVCFDDRCRELCGPDILGEDKCDGERVCTVAVAPLPGLCLEPCLLLTQACSVAGDACNTAVGSAGANLAVCTANPGVGVDGEPCESDGDCLPSYLCTAAELHVAPCLGDAARCCAQGCDLFEDFCLGPEMVCYLLGIEDQPDAGYCGL